MVRKPDLRQFRPGRVYQTVTTLMEHRLKEDVRVPEPVWYKVLENIPPSEILTRPLATRIYRPNFKQKHNLKPYRPQPLHYLEDQLRNTFYKDHPWELSRPRMMVELDGRDWERFNWSKGLRQSGIPLCGESVVQCQKWLLENVQGISRKEAYDYVRKEYYQLKYEEAVERRIAKEEARMVGSYFGQDYNTVGMHNEDMMFDKWKKWAAKEVAKNAARRAERAETDSSAASEEEIQQDEGLKDEDSYVSIADAVALQV